MRNSWLQSFSTTAAMIPRALFVVLLSVTGIVSAQFQFFDGMFGGSQQQQQPQRSGAEQYVAQYDAVSCSKYLCPSTLDCVDRPVHCPCPHAEDVKCIVPDKSGIDVAADGTVLCVQGQDSCAHIEKLLLKGSGRK